jgi:hypothetical protein
VSTAPTAVYWTDDDDDPAHHAYFDLNATGAVVLGFAHVLYGWSIKNVSTTTEANIDFYDGADSSGLPTFPVNLTGNETNREMWPRGVLMKNALYINVTAQEVKGSVFFRRVRW